VNRAEVLVGSGRLLELFPSVRAERIFLGSAVEETLSVIEARAERQSVAVLVTGDPGLFSLSRLVLRRFGRDRCRIISGVSSVQAAFAALGVDWADARIISAHKKDPELDSSWAEAKKIAVLGGRESSLQWIAQTLLPTLGDCRVFVCENLTMEDEQVREIDPRRLVELSVSSRTVVLILKKSVLG